MRVSHTHLKRTRGHQNFKVLLMNTSVMITPLRVSITTGRSAIAQSQITDISEYVIPPAVEWATGCYYRAKPGRTVRHDEHMELEIR